MSLIISNNLNSLQVQTNLAANQSNLASAMQRLSSGLRINSAKDDAAGLAIATGLASQSAGDGVAIQNANSASSLMQIADGGLASITNDLQTLRNLAVQSANGTNSAANRAALNTQAQQVIADIQNVASTTNYNGVNLLSGGFNNQFQVGANAGQTLSVAIGNVQTSSLGAGQGTGLSAQGTSSAISSGDLVVNGTIVGNSLATSDNASYSSASASAIAKAAAINAVSAQSGVTATVNTNVAIGTSQVVANGTGSVVLNGVTVNLSVNTALSNDANRNAVVSALNAVTGQTGVTAVNTGSDTTGITLQAADGRNIVVGAFTTVTAATTGLAGTGTYYGGYTLTSSTPGGSVSIQQGTGTLSNSGLQAGTFSSGSAQVSSTSLGNITANTGLQSGDLVINGVTIGTSLATADSKSFASNKSSAIAIAADINNATASTGVTATVNQNQIQGSAFAATAGNTGTININGVKTATLTMTGTLSTDLANETNAINNISGQTGVTATNDGSNIRLTAADGRNISLAAGAATDTLTYANMGISSTYITQASTVAKVTGGSYTLSGAGTIAVTTTTGNNVANGGMLQASYGGAATGTFLSNVNISTVAGANSAITAVDNALGTVNNIRASVGAFANRISATVSNLQTAQTNLTSANTTITGADFAAETANLSRAQVLQQAGISILSQANALSQNVLTLLR